MKGLRDRATSGGRKPGGFTLIEILVVVVVIGIMAGAGAMIITPQISYFRSRRDAENIVEALRKARATAMARGGSGGNHGVIFFRGKLNTARDTVEGYSSESKTPFSFVAFRDSDSNLLNNDPNLDEVSRPLASNLAQAKDESEASGGTPIAPHVNGLHDETTLVKRHDPDVPDSPGTEELADATIIQFNPAGRLDPARSTLGSLEAESPAGVGYTFDIYNPNMGYYRVRIRGTGSIEFSALADAAEAPYYVDASGEHKTF